MWNKRKEGKEEAAVPAMQNTGKSGQSAKGESGIPEEVQQFWRGKLVTAAFGGIVGLFIRSQGHRHYTLADLEWCLVPPVMLNQFLMAESKLPNGQGVPAAVVLWARVSEEVDARLKAKPQYPIRLHPAEWKSGDIFWVVDVLGDPKAAQGLIDALAKNVFQGKPFKMLSRQRTQGEQEAVKAVQ